MRITRGAVTLSGALALSCALCSCSSSPATKEFVPLRGGCFPAKGTPPVPMTITHPDGGTQAFVSVCVDGRGPYKFLVDSGASVSLVDSDLASTLDLPSAQPSTSAVGIGCITASQEVKIANWSMDGVQLAGQSVLSANVPGFGLSDSVAGLIGSDVLSRFGAIRVDYGRKLLTVLAPQGAPPVTATILRPEPPLPSPPPLLVKGTPSGATITVLKTPHSALATSAVAFGAASPSEFVVDTGSPISSVAPSVASQAGLSKTGTTVSSPGVGCQGTSSTVNSGTWSFGGIAASPRPLASVSLAKSNNAAVAGTIGSDLLSSYGSVVIDYRTGVLWLGAG